MFYRVIARIRQWRKRFGRAFCLKSPAAELQTPNAKRLPCTTGAEDN
jgi:hypothetical protein